MAKAPDPAEERDKAEERGSALMKGHKVTFEVPEVRKALWGVSKSITLGTGTLVQPTGAGTNIRDNLETTVSSIVDQVQVQDLTGMGSLLEPYVITESDAKGGKVTTNAGTARTASADPTFGVSKIAPYELNVTNYVDRNISRLSPANYYAKIYGMSMRAMRRKLAELIVNGDGQSTPDMYGMKNAKNQAGSAIFATENLTAINENTLDLLFYAYGGDEEIAGNARLFLNKADLKAFGQIRGTADKNRVYKVHPDTGNPNIGMIEDGGNFVASFSATPANTQRTFEVYDDYLVHGDGEYRISLFAQGMDGSWNDNHGFIPNGQTETMLMADGLEFLVMR